MNVHKWISGVRLFLGFLLAPAVLSVSMEASLGTMLARLGAHPDGPAKIMYALAYGVAGLAVPYLAALCFGLACLVGSPSQGRLGFRTVMITTLIFSPIYSIIVYSSLSDMCRPRPLAEAVAFHQGLAAIIAGLCFYFIGVWKPGRKGHHDDK